MEELENLYVRYLHTNYEKEDFKVGQYIKSITEHQGYFEITYNGTPEIKIIPKGRLYYWTKVLKEKFTSD